MRTTVLNGKDVRNGNYKATEATTKEEAKVPGTEAKDQAPATEEPKEVKDQEAIKEAPASLPVSALMVRPVDRFERAEQFARLKSKYQFLHKRSGELEAFKMSDDTTNSTITINSANGEEITINNPDVIKKVVELCGDVLNRLLAEAENEVLKFEI